MIPLEPPKRDEREEFDNHGSARLGGAIGSAGYRPDDDDPSAPKLEGEISGISMPGEKQKGKIERISARDLLAAREAEAAEAAAQEQDGEREAGGNENSGTSAIRSFGAGRNSTRDSKRYSQPRSDAAREAEEAAERARDESADREDLPSDADESTLEPETHSEDGPVNFEKAPEGPRLLGGATDELLAAAGGFGEEPQAELKPQEEDPERPVSRHMLFASDARPTVPLSDAAAWGQLEPRTTGKVALAQGPLTLELMQRNFDKALGSEKRAEVVKLLAMMDFMPEAAMLEVLSRYERPVEIDLAKILPSDIALQQIPRDVALAHGVCPIALLGDVLIVASAPPLKPETVNDLRYLTGKLIKLCIADTDHLELTLERVYRKGGPLLDDSPGQRVDTSRAGKGEPAPNSPFGPRHPESQIDNHQPAQVFDPLTDAARMLEDYPDDEADAPAARQTPVVERRADDLRDRFNQAAMELEASSTSRDPYESTSPAADELRPESPIIDPESGRNAPVHDVSMEDPPAPAAAQGELSAAEVARIQEEERARIRAEIEAERASSHDDPQARIAAERESYAQPAVNDEAAIREEAAAAERARIAAEEREKIAAEEAARNAAAERERIAAEERERIAAEEREKIAAENRERERIAEQERQRVADEERKAKLARKAEEEKAQAEREAAEREERQRRAQAEAEAAMKRAQEGQAKAEAAAKPAPSPQAPAKDPAESTAVDLEPVSDKDQGNANQNGTSAAAGDLPVAKPLPRPTHGYDAPVSQRSEAAPSPEQPPNKPATNVRLPGDKIHHQMNSRAPMSKRQIQPKNADDSSIEEFGEFK